MPTEISERPQAPARVSKRSHPDWGQHTVLLEKEVHRAAVDIVWRHFKDEDMSTLINHLVKEWVADYREAAQRPPSKA